MLSDSEYVHTGESKSHAYWMPRQSIVPTCKYLADTGGLRTGNGGLWWRICQSARLSPLLTWVQFPLGTTYDSYVKRVSQRSAESRGFSPLLPQGMLTVWVGLTLTGPSIAAVLRDGEQ